MINQANYFAKVNEIGISNLSETLKKGHTILEKATKNGEKWKTGSETIDTMIKNHLVLMNTNYKDEPKSDFKKELDRQRKSGDVEKDSDSISISAMSKRQQEPKVSVSPKDNDLDTNRNPEYDHLKLNKPNKMKKNEKKLLEKPKKVATKKAATKKAPCKPKTIIKVKEKIVKTKLKPAAKTKRVKSLELDLLQRYVNLDGKKMLYPGVIKYHKALDRAITENLITEHITLIKEIRSSFSNAIAKMKELKANEIDITCKSDIKAKANGILAAPTVKLRVEYLGDTSLGK